MRVLGIVIALVMLSTLAACVTTAPLVTGECTDATATSLTAHATVNSLEAGSLSRRGFVFAEWTEGDPDPALNVTLISLINPSFEDRDPPTGWGVYQASIVRVSDPVKAGNYSVEITSQEGKAGITQQQNPIPTSEAAGKSFTFGAWVYATAGNRTCLMIRDTMGGQDLKSYSAYHPGDGSWHWLTVTMTLRSSLDAWRVEIRIESGTVIAVYADGAALIENAVFEDGDFGTGAYSLNITGLKPNTSYVVRAFVQNEAGISYGNTVTCKTL